MLLLLLGLVYFTKLSYSYMYTVDMERQLSKKVQRTIFIYVYISIYICLLFSHLLRLFVHTALVTEELKTYLNSGCYTEGCVQILEYGQERTQLKAYLTRPNVRVWVGTEYTNQALYELIPEVRYPSVWA